MNLMVDQRVPPMVKHDPVNFLTIKHRDGNNVHPISEALQQRLPDMSSGVTVFIPLYNEESILHKNVDRLCEYMTPLHRPYEIILGSNGSTDHTPLIGSELDKAYSNVIFFHVPLRGPGLAFTEALKRAAYPYFICLDADLSFELNFIKRAIEALHEFDAVVGSKQLGSQKRPFIRILGSDLFIACTNFLLHMPYRDYSIGAKAYRTESIRPFLDKIDRHTFYTQQLLYQLRKSNKKIIEVPVHCEDRRKSKFNLFHEGFYRYGKLFELWLWGLRK